MDSYKSYLSTKGKNRSHRENKKKRKYTKRNPINAKKRPRYMRGQDTREDNLKGIK